MLTYTHMSVGHGSQGQALPSWRGLRTRYESQGVKQVEKWLLATRGSEPKSLETA